MNIYTIGYAQRAIESFVETLKKNNVNALADVRSLPYSRMFPEYNADHLSETLKKNGIAYIPLGKELGPRSENDDDYLEDGTVSFSKLRTNDLFLSGIQRLKNGLDKGFNIAMMCAEKDHVTCHRNLLISQHLLEDEGFDVSHIKYDGSLELQSQSLNRISEIHGLFPDMFRDQKGCIEEALIRQTLKHSYKREINNELSI